MGNEVSAPLSLSRRTLLRGSLAGVGLGVAGSALAACGSSSPSGGSTGRTTVHFVTAKLASGSKTMQEFVNDYNNSQSKYNVEVTELPTSSSSTEVHQLLAQQLSNKSADIDAFTQDIVWVAEFADSGWSMDLTKEFNDADRATWFPANLKAATWQNQLHAIPWNITAGLLYYRKDLLSAANYQPPTSWIDQLVPQAQHFVSAKTTTNGFNWQAAQAEAMVCDLVEFIASAGGSILSDDGKQAHIAEAPAIEAVQFMYDTMNRYAITPKAALAWAEQPSREDFWAGNAAFMRMWSSSWKNTQDPATSKVVGKVGLSSLPQFPGGKTASCLGGYQLGVAANAKNKDGALDFLRWMSSTTVEKAYYDMYGYPAANVEFWKNGDIANTDIGKAVLNQVNAGGTPRPITPKYGQITLQLQSYVSKALTNGDVKAQLTECQGAINKILSS